MENDQVLVSDILCNIAYTARQSYDPLLICVHKGEVSIINNNEHEREGPYIVICSLYPIVVDKAYYDIILGNDFTFQVSGRNFNLGNSFLRQPTIGPDYDSNVMWMGHNVQYVEEKEHVKVISKVDEE